MTIEGRGQRAEGDAPAETEGLIAATVAARFGAGARVVAVEERRGGEQGFSGATLRYYDVIYTLAETRGQIALVIKDAPLVERRASDWLARRGLPVPFSVAPDLTTDGLAPLCMECAGATPPPDERARAAAQALAAIHGATLGRGDEFPWLPRADPNFFAERLLDRCWRGPWRHLLTGAGYTDWYGRDHPPGEPDAAFGSAFADCGPALEEAAARFLHDMTTLWAAGDTLALLHADFHGEHVRWQDDMARIIDWDQAHYGPPYVDLPNYFTRDEALLHRDALAALGHAIPRERFLAGYAAARPYPGFKYFGIGLWNWRHGDPARRREHVQYWINLVLGQGKYGSGR